MNNITFIGCSHNESREQSPLMDSLIAQTDKNWQAIIYNNGPRTTVWDLPQDSRITYMESDTDSGNWGTKNRQAGIDMCETSWIVQTSIHDYWLPQAVQYINEILNKHEDIQILYWDSINHVVGPCLKLDGQLAWSKCDWGQFALKTWIAKKVGIQRGAVYCGDWAFVEDVLKSGYIKKTMKLTGILTCHN